MITKPEIKFLCDGIRFGRAECDAQRVDLIALRDGALKQACFEEAVSLSHTIALLSMMADYIWGKAPPGGDMAAGIIHEPGTNG